jgi:hypothetical protein
VHPGDLAAQIDPRKEGRVKTGLAHHILECSLVLPGRTSGDHHAIQIALGDSLCDLLAAADQTRIIHGANHHHIAKISGIARQLLKIDDRTDLAATIAKEDA